MTERQSRIDHMAGPSHWSDDFEGSVTGGPDLASYTPNGPRRDGGSPPAVMVPGVVASGAGGQPLLERNER